MDYVKAVMHVIYHPKDDGMYMYVVYQGRARVKSPTLLGAYHGMPHDQYFNLRKKIDQTENIQLTCKKNST